jgi:hypothetical protein
VRELHPGDTGQFVAAGALEEGVPAPCVDDGMAVSVDARSSVATLSTEPSSEIEAPGGR